MAQTINVDELVPDDLEFTFRGTAYLFPGDIDVETTFLLSRLLGELQLAETEMVLAVSDLLRTDDPKKEAAARRKEAAAQAVVEKVTLRVQAELLTLFQIKQPELERLPFGATGFKVVLAQVLAGLGFGDVAADPTPAPTKAPSVKKAARKPSTRSRSSRT